MREATGTGASVSGEHVVGPVFWKMMDGVGIATVHNVSLLDEVALPLEEVRVHFIALKVGFNFGPVGSFSVDVDADKNLVGKGL
jgi:hypothetical protein